MTLARQVQQAQWVLKELQVQQVRVARLDRRDYVVKQAQLVYKDLQVQQVPQVPQARRDY